MMSIPGMMRDPTRTNPKEITVFMLRVKKCFISRNALSTEITCHQNTSSPVMREDFPFHYSYFPANSCTCQVQP